jgi:putative ABC transport system permease protein
MNRPLQDLRLAWRSLTRMRAIHAFVILAFALGIGVTTAVFSLFHGVLLKPLPYPNPDELVIVYDTQPACTTCPASFEKHQDWKTRSTVFAALGGSFTPMVVVNGAGEPERVQAAGATASLMDVFRINPAIGRWISESEDQAGGHKVVVLTDGYWRRRFGGDPNVLGRTLSINGEPHEVIGVMPPRFSHRRAELFIPVQRKFDPSNRGSHFLATYGRLKPGVTLAQAQQEMRALGATLAKEFGHNHGIDVQSYSQVVVSGVAQPLRVLMGAVLLLLLIACANVANLLLAAGLARRRELAVRTALGATRWDLARQLTIESVTLAVVGGALGVLLAQWAIQTFVRLADSVLPRTAIIEMDSSVLLFALGLSVVTGLVCGLWPVVRLKTHTLGMEVREGDLRGGSAASGRRFGNSLVVIEIALAFMLLVGAGLLVKNLLSLEARDTGFRSEGLVTFDLAPSGPRYRDQSALTGFYRDLAPKLATLPGVASVGLTSHLPMQDFGWNGEVRLEGGNPWPANAAPLVERNWVGADYFKTMRTDIVRGRPFDERDRQGMPLVTILSERTAEKFWPGQNPIGKRFFRNAGPGNSPVEVIGVARDVRTYGLARVSPYIMYVSIEQEPFGAMTVVLRTESRNPTDVIPGARKIIAAMDPLLPLARVQTMTEVVGKSVTQPRLLSSLTTLFGGLAGLLAVVGVYGVMAYNVRRARREFGIRLALGADPARVRRLVVGRGLLLGTIGVVLGAAGALLLTRTIQALLDDVKPTDPAVFIGTGIALLVVCVAAGFVPALQASRTDPMIVLRAD